MATDELLRGQQRIKRMINRLINIFYPSTCPICGKVLENKIKTCRECEQKIEIIREPKCCKCGKPLNTHEKLKCRNCMETKRYFEKGVSIFEYKDKIRESIYKFKYDNARIFARFYAEAAVSMYGKLLKEWKIDIIVPVPIHKSKELQRGYNQAEVFAKEISKLTGIAYENKLLVRVKKTVPQKELEDSMRYVNLKNAFAIDTNRAKGICNALVVDDIFTTGSTVDACSMMLKKAGIQKVYVLCISAGKDD